MPFQAIMRDVLPMSAKLAIARVITSPPIGRALRTLYKNRIPCGPYHFATDSSLVIDSTVAALWFGLYESAEIAMTKNYLPPMHDVIELGASLGVNTCHIASKLDDGRRVIAVEPDPDLANLARKNVAQNGLAEKVEFVQRAVAYDGTDAVSFARFGDSLGGGTIAERMTLNRDEIKVPATTLSAILTEHQISEFSLVSDIEGAEIPLLLNEAEALKKCHAILIEMDGGIYRDKTYRADDIAQIIMELGFVQKFRHGGCATFTRRVDEPT